MNIYGKDIHEKPFDRIINSYKGDLIGVEIGVWDGNHAMNMLKMIPQIKTLYLIDPYRPYKEGRAIRVSKEVQTAYSIFKRNILDTDLRNRCIFIQKESSKATEDVPNDLDFVYIDGNHEYTHAKEDIELYYSKVKSGGLFGGDDYNYPRFEGVTRAVDEFIRKNNLELHTEEYAMHTNKVIEGFRTNTDWWVIKP